MKRFYAGKDGLSGATVILAADETRHLRDVLRLRTGDEVSVFDGTGREYICAIGPIGKKETVLTLVSETTPASPESKLALTLAAAMLKGEKFDLVVQKAVELGVTDLVPLATEHSDVKIRDRSDRVERWRRIALEATKQSGRARLMDIALPVAFDEFIDKAQADETVLFSERNGGKFSSVNGRDNIVAVIGPEGGWSDREIDAARSRGITIVTLGGRILRQKRLRYPSQPFCKTILAI